MKEKNQIGPKIIQIVAALPGWRAAYEGANGAIDEDPVALWALIEEDGVTFPAPYGPVSNGGPLELDRMDDASNFLGVLAPGEGHDRLPRKS